LLHLDLSGVPMQASTCAALSKRQLYLHRSSAPVVEPGGHVFAIAQAVQV
jgi:hypothetical protein